MLCLVREEFKVEHSGVFCAANCLNTGSLMKSTVSTTSLWNSTQLALLNGILAQLIPSGANGTIPSAAEFGVADFVAQKVSDNPELQLLFTQGLEYLETLLKSSEKTAAELSNKEWIALVSQLEKANQAFSNAPPNYLHGLLQRVSNSTTFWFVCGSYPTRRIFGAGR